MSDQNPASTTTADAAATSTAAAAVASPTTTQGTDNASAAPVTTSAPAATATPAATTTPATSTTAAAPIEYKLELPKDSALPADALPKVAEFARSLGLNQEQAQKLLVAQSAGFAAQQKAQTDALTKQAADWEAAAKVDPEFGGEKYADNLQAAQSAFTKFGNPELKQALEQAGYANFPPLLRFAAAIGKAMREDSVGGTQAVMGTQTNDAALRAAYPTMFPG